MGGGGVADTAVRKTWKMSGGEGAAVQRKSDFILNQPQNTCFNHSDLWKKNNKKQWRAAPAQRRSSHSSQPGHILIVPGFSRAKFWKNAVHDRHRLLQQHQEVLLLLHHSSLARIRRTSLLMCKAIPGYSSRPQGDGSGPPRGKMSTLSP